MGLYDEVMITILMATHNGEKYIAEQIESILGQTDKDWKLVIQDDCSTDRTSEIARRYAEGYPKRVSFLQLEKPSGSAKANFFSMLKYADTEYMMTCDQDDVWLPDKIKITLEKMHEMESKFGSAIPLLVHTDLKVVDERLNKISDSLFNLQNLNSRRNQLNHIMVQNIVTGCTMMVNRALTVMVQDSLKQQAIEWSVPHLPTLQQAIMHDWWFALAAAALGHIGFVSEPTVLYRQHGHNEVGAKNTGSLRYNIGRLLNNKQSGSALEATYNQADCFLKMYGSKLTPLHHEIVKVYCSIPDCSKVKRLRTIFRYDFWKNGLYRRCGQILFT